MLCLLGLTGLPALAANDDALVRNNFGSVGLVEMPSARMAPDGEFSAGASFFENTQHYNFGFQIMPWLETSFRYSGLRHFDSAYPVYYDRSFAVKARLWDETDVFPTVAVGVDDVVGTGIYSGEYLVASKRFGALDASLGIGWGRLGSTALFRNPLTFVLNSFKNRTQFPDIVAGSTSFNTLFHGQSSGLFGGVVWHTPIEKLSAIAEYSSDTYAAETSRGNFRPRNQMNYGVSYQAANGVTLQLSWLYGRSVGGNILFELDPAHSQYPAKIGPVPLPVAIRTSDEQRQALLTMIQQRAGLLNSSTRTSAGRTAFVDALWQQQGISNVEIVGKSLVLTASGDAGRRCITTAQITQFFGGSIEAVIVRSSDGLKPVRCVTAAATAPAYQNITLSEKSPLSASQSDIKDVQTIDAVIVDKSSALHAIRKDAQSQRINVEALELTDSTATLYYDNSHYFAEIDALDRLTRVLMKDAPGGVEKFRLIAVENGVPQQEYDILRGPEERKFAQADALDIWGDTSGTTITRAPMQNPALAAAERKSYPRFSWSVFPQLRQELFDPDNPFAIQLAAEADASILIVPGLSINGEAETSLYDNFNIDRQSNSLLPHVRSDFLKYFSQGKTGLGALDFEYRFRIAPDIFAVAKAGYLESMFAGGGGELLWRPEGQRWALGVDGYEVWQRNFDRLFGLQNYQIFTGHIALYYASPWYDLNFAVRAGQYLAGDRGLTFQVTRRFPTGVEIGAFFTKTNVSAEQFGEGSFDKGIVIRIPLGWVLPIETQGQWGIDLRPVQRDGGQQLIGDATLYEETRRDSEAELFLTNRPH
jgi:Exopolysaccharide biosynthesis protein YbjH